ncbi:Abi family protein [Hyphococcus luteus]|nr:Abi family protein [Marinicaulis flavus]
MTVIPPAPRGFTKPALSVDDQLELLEGRGLQISDREEAKHCLHHIGYYRLSGYFLPFQKGGRGPDRHEFLKGTDFKDALDRYVFDRKLRLLVLDATERIEVAFRASLSNSIAIKHGPNWYQDSKLFNLSRHFNHAKFIQHIKEQISHDSKDAKKRDVFINHYYLNYDTPDMPPCWMVFEAVSFGSISIAFKNMDKRECNDICDKFGLKHQFLSSWIHCISYIRNVCAHHSRLWNRVCTIKPLIDKKYRDDLEVNNKVYAQLAVIQIILKQVSPDNHWAERLKKLMSEHPNVPLKQMGMPADWSEREIWKA